MRRHTEAAHELFVGNPKGDAVKVLTDAEGASARNPSLFAPRYGQILERMTGNSVQADPCLSRFVVRLSDPQQRQPGDNPDFRGLGRATGLELDITTRASAKTKSEKEGKANYIFLIYERQLVLDGSGTKRVPTPQSTRITVEYRGSFQ